MDFGRAAPAFVTLHREMRPGHPGRTRYPRDTIVGLGGVAYNRHEETKMHIGRRLGRFALAAAALVLAATAVL
ncbi:MAG: hypothetical protein ACE5EU_14225, partial [Paracoccaceae bacterium]